MIRSMVAILCVVCVATLLTEALGLGLLWYRGQLTPDMLREIRAVLAGQQLEPPLPEEKEDDKPQPSTDEVMDARISRLFQITTREDELAMFKALLLQKTNALTAQQQQFEEQRRAFDERLKALDEAAVSEATERSRAVLLALPGPEAVSSLMALPLEEDVRLLSGMPEKSIAKILKEFLQGDENQKERGREIFEAITRGDPKRNLIENAGAPGEMPQPVAGTAP